MAKVRDLRKLIYGMYDSEADFARHLGWERRRLNKITNGAKEPSVTEVNAIATGLSESVETIAQIFLQQSSPIGQRCTDRQVG